MVIRRLGAVADRADQHQRRRPAVGLVDAADPAILEIPSGKRLQPLANLGLGIGSLFLRHATSITRLPSYPITKSQVTSRLRRPRELSDRSGRWQRAMPETQPRQPRHPLCPIA